MKKSTINRVYLILLSSIIIIQILSGFSIFNEKILLDYQGLECSETSQTFDINGESGWLSLKLLGRCEGSGSESDPFLIKDLEINANNSGSCIRVRNTYAHFKIENCSLINSESSHAGIELMNCANGVLVNNSFKYNYYGISIWNSLKIEVKENKITSSTDFAIYFSHSNKSYIFNNSLWYNAYGLNLLGSNYNDVMNNSIGANNIGLAIRYNSNYNNISKNEIVYNNIGIQFISSKCNTLQDNTINNNGVNIEGTQDVCNPFPISIELILVLVIGGIIVLGISGFLVYKKRKSKHLELEVESKDMEQEKYIEIEKAETGLEKGDSKLEKEDIKLEQVPITAPMDFIEEELPDITETEKIETILKPELTLEHEEEKEPVEEILLSTEPPKLELELDEITEEDIYENVPHFCTNCGKPLVNTWKICANCGVVIDKNLWRRKPKREIKKERILPAVEASSVPVTDTSPQIEKSSLKQIDIESEPTLRKDIKTVEIGEIKFKTLKPIPSIEVKKEIEELEKESLLKSDKLETVEKKIKQEPVESKPLKNLCPFCGFENKLDKVYCNQCGYKLKGT